VGDGQIAAARESLPINTFVQICDRRSALVMRNPTQRTKVPSLLWSLTAESEERIAGVSIAAQDVRRQHYLDMPWVCGE